MVVSLFSLLGAAFPLQAGAAGSAQVGDGSAASCTEAAFDDALATVQSNGGGLITFRCGLNPHTIVLTDAKAITTNVRIGRQISPNITLSGGGVNTNALFRVQGGASLQLNRLTLSDVDSGNDGGAVVVNGDGSVEINDSVIENNIAFQGGGLINDGTGLVEINRSTFRGNEADFKGGAILNRNGTVEINDSTFEGNYSEWWGGAIFASEDAGVVRIKGSQFIGNSSRLEGGGIHNADDGLVQIWHSSFSENEVISGGADGGAIANFDTARVEVWDSAFTANHAPDVGGAIHNEDDGVVMIHSGTTFTGNTTDGGGGAIWSQNSGSTLSISGTTFTENFALFNGGAVWSGGVLEIADSSFTNNGVATDSEDEGEGGAISTFGTATIHNTVVADNTAWLGAGIVDSGDSLTIVDSEISGNQATRRAGGIASFSDFVSISNTLIARNTTDLSWGAGLYTSIETMEIIDSVFDGNESASVGGGAAFLGGTFHVTGTLFTNNKAGGGGGIWTNRPDLVTITDSTFDGNSATGRGGGIDHPDNAGGEFTVSNSTFTNNSAGSDGGGMNARGDMTIEGSTFSGNTAGRDGGGLHLTLGTKTIISSTISDNSATRDGGGIFVSRNETVANITSTTITNSTTGDGASGAVHLNQGAMTLAQTIVADQASGADCAGAVTSGDHNLDSDNTCSLIGANDIPAGNADLGPLTDNGGYTLTHLPNPPSDAIDGGGLTCVATDQRGQNRPKGSGCDIGSVETTPIGQLTEFCYVFNTGQLVSPPTGQCSPGQYPISANGPIPLVFCIDPFTGALGLTFSGACTPPDRTHDLVEGDLLVCWNLSTGALRAVAHAGQCSTPWELPRIIPD